MHPVAPPLAQTTHQVAEQPSFRDRIRNRTLAVVNHAAMMRSTYTTEQHDGKEYIVIRVPKEVALDDIRWKEEKDANTGKITQSATLVISCSQAADADPDVFVMDAEKDQLITLPCKPTINLNVGLDWRKRVYTDLGAGTPAAPAA